MSQAGTLGRLERQPSRPVGRSTFLPSNRAPSSLARGTGELGLAIARGIRYNAGNKEAIKIIAESAITDADKSGANLVVLTRLGPTRFLSQVFEAASADEGWGFVQATSSPWDAQCELVVIVGFDDRGLAAAASTFRKMDVRDLHGQPQLVSERALDARRQAKVLGLSVAELEQLDAAIASYLQGCGIEVPRTARPWSYRRESEDGREVAVGTSTWRSPVLVVAAAIDPKGFAVLRAHVEREDGSRVDIYKKKGSTMMSNFAVVCWRTSFVALVVLSSGGVLLMAADESPRVIWTDRDEPVLSPAQRVAVSTAVISYVERQYRIHPVDLVARCHPVEREGSPVMVEAELVFRMPSPSC